uniref:Uncharacterized protein n=1 Tax=Setaria italica TaxID=4555 RepID=K4ANU7_SETIT
MKWGFRAIKMELSTNRRATSEPVAVCPHRPTTIGGTLVVVARNLPWHRLAGAPPVCLSAMCAPGTTALPSGCFSFASSDHLTSFHKSPV